MWFERQPNDHDLNALLSPEAQLITACARVQWSDQKQQDVLKLLQESLDWDYVQRHAARHGLEPLMYRHLSGLAAHVPEGALGHLATRARQATFQNLRQLEELLGITQDLEERGIPVIPFKGPVLAAQAYGDVAYRPFVDLDLMVARSDVLRVKEYLLAQGYQPAQDFNAQAEAEHIDAQLGYEFIHPESGFIVEVHWTFFFEIYAFDLNPNEVWDRHQTLELSGRTVRTLGSEDLFIYLCAHGTKHRWMRLKWVADVAEFVRSTPQLDWDLIARQANQLGTRRMVHLGCYLAHQLLGAPIPVTVLNDAQASRTVQAMAERICREWLFREPDAPRTPELEVFRFHLKERERWRDRWPYVKHHLSLWLGP